MAATPESLMYLLQQLPEGATWTVAGIGPAQLPLGVMAIALGGHVRVGFEDNIFFRKGELASSNAQLVQRMATAPAGPDHTASSGAGAGWGNSLTHKPGASIGLGSGTQRTLTLPCVQPGSWGAGESGAPPRV
jgi:hypothetical protein